MTTIHINQIKGKEIFYYEDWISRQVIIGVRGIGEFKIPIWDIVRAEDSFRLQNGRKWTEEEGVQWAIKYAQKESQYIEFKEVNNQKLLS